MMLAVLYRGLTLPLSDSGAVKMPVPSLNLSIHLATSCHEDVMKMVH